MSSITNEMEQEAKKRLNTVVDQVLAYMLKDIEVYAPENISTYEKEGWVSGEMERISSAVIEKIQKKDEDK